MFISRDQHLSHQKFTGLVTAAQSWKYVNVNTLTGKLVKFADDTNLRRFGRRQDCEKLQMHQGKLCESLRRVNGVSSCWVAVGRERKNQHIQHQRKEVKLEGSSVIKWPSTKIVSSSFQICVLNLTLPMSERKWGDRNRAVHHSEADSHSQKLFLLIGVLIMITVNHLLIPYQILVTMIGHFTYVIILLTDYMRQCRGRS